MRHGLMTWRESELSQSDVLARQRRLQAAMRAANLDAMVFYTNHVRSGGVTFVTGFTPYWADALLLLPAEGRAIFATALSKRVGEWIKSTSPTVDVMHSPQPGRLVGERLVALGATKVGVVELDRLPGGLVDEMTAAAKTITLSEASGVFGHVRGMPDAAEAGFARKADSIAVAAFAAAPKRPTRVGDVTEMLELTVRNAGAEECYVAIAPDLVDDVRFARVKGAVTLGAIFAVRLSVAYGGVWIRRTETFARDGADEALGALACAADDLAAGIDPNGNFASDIEKFAWPGGFTLADWIIEAPQGTWPLRQVASRGAPTVGQVSYGVLGLRFAGRAPALLARPVGIAGAGASARVAAE
jgi:hypothetical protein